MLKKLPLCCAITSTIARFQLTNGTHDTMVNANSKELKSAIIRTSTAIESGNRSWMQGLKLSRSGF